MHKQHNHLQAFEENYGGYPHKSKKVFDEQKKQWEALEETMKNDLEYFIALAKYYYTNNTKEGSEQEENNQEDIYTLIKNPQNPKKDILILIKKDEVPEVGDTEKEKIEAKKYFQWPLPIFVVPAWTEKDHNQEAKNFLSDNATLYFSPSKWWNIQVRNTARDKSHPIDYTHANIAHYADVILLLQNAIIHKRFSNPKIFHKLFKKIEELKKYSPERLYQRDKDTHEYNQDEEEKIIYKAIHECLSYMGQWDNEKMFNLIQSFDLHTQEFVQIHTF